MTSRILRFGPPLIAGVMVIVAVHPAHAEDTVDSLLRDRRRLDAVQAGCKINAPWATEALCKTASQALRRRFFGGGVHYAPQHVEPFPGQAGTPSISPKEKPSSTSSPRTAAPADPR